MQLAAILISLSAISLSLYTYFKHDRLIKNQAVLLNKYQIERIEKDKENERKAVIEANVYRLDGGKSILKVYNKGKSLAKQVNVKFPEIKGFQIMNNPCPIDIRPQIGVDITLILYTNSPDKIIIQFEWDDEFKANNSDSQTVQLY